MQAKLSNIISRIEELLNGGDSIIVAIDGRCGSGKTTMAEELVARFGGSIFHMDDFFLRPEQRTDIRLQRAGENVDHERFLEEVLGPLRTAIIEHGDSIEYRRYDCHKQILEEAKRIPVGRVNIIEGTYSLRPDLINYYDLKIFLDVGTDLQKERIESRNSAEMAERFFKEWIPMEEKYFNEMEIRDKADIVYESNK